MTRLDRYLAVQLLGTFAAVVGIVLSMMLLEHLPTLLDLVRVAGHARTVIARSVLGLLPEYLGLGLIVGVYLAIALTVRRMSLRGELEAIEASGVGPARWLRVPALLVLLTAAATFANQGWLLPAGRSARVHLDFGPGRWHRRGLLAGLGAVMSSARLYAANGLQLGQSYELDAIAAVILGGTSFVGGVGSIVGTLIGALIIAVLTNGLVLLGVSDIWQYIIKGLVIIGAVALDRYRQRDSART